MFQYMDVYIFQELAENCGPFSAHIIHTSEKKRPLPIYVWDLFQGYVAYKTWHVHLGLNMQYVSNCVKASIKFHESLSGLDCL